MQIKLTNPPNMNMNASIQFIYRRLRCLLHTNLFAQIAQLVEQRTENPRVTGSIPVLGTLQVWFNGRTPAFQAGDVGSIPITCSQERPQVFLRSFFASRAQTRTLVSQGLGLRFASVGAKPRSTGPRAPHHLRPITRSFSE